MPAAPASLAWARSTVRHACEDWELPPEVREAALLVATELVTNAVVHARTASVLSVGLDHTGLHVASATARRPRRDHAERRDGRWPRPARGRGPEPPGA
jgi:anti-sigma regulatory factor (Ser/Thr protein kinase)